MDAFISNLSCTFQGYMQKKTKNGDFEGTKKGEERLSKLNPREAPKRDEGRETPGSLANGGKARKLQKKGVKAPLKIPIFKWEEKTNGSSKKWGNAGSKVEEKVHKK